MLTSVTPSIIDLIGGTPLIRLRRLERDLPGVELYAKAEWMNPGGSVKDRPALRMVQEGLAAGRLVPGQVILDATSGKVFYQEERIGALGDNYASPIGSDGRICIFSQAGVGVVADSDLEAEYQESHQKARALVRAAEEAVRFASAAKKGQ